MSLDFYNNPDLADGFGATAGRERPHRGLDFPKRTGTPVPSLQSGAVVVSEWHPGLGWVVEVRGDDNVFLGYCHLNKQGLPVGTRVSVGTEIGVVGDTGTQSLGPHLHLTKGDRRGAVFGASMAYLSDPWPYVQNYQGEEEMTPEQAQQLSAVYAALFGPANLGVPKTTWARPFGEPGGEAYYGMFDVLIRLQSLVVAQQGQQAAILEALKQVSGGNIDLKALEAAAERGAREAIAGLTLKATG